VIGQIVVGTAQGTKQDKSLVTKAPKLKKENGLLDWTRHGRDVCNQIRAMQPWPTAYTYWHHSTREPMRLIISKAAWREMPGVNPKPGEPQAGDAGRLVIGAGSGSVVEVLELQPAGKRRMSAADFLRGHHPQPGDRFGAELS